MTTGNLPRKALSGYGTKILQSEQTPVDVATLTRALRESGLVVDEGSDPAPPLLAALSDNDWVALQGICEG